MKTGLLKTTIKGGVEAALVGIQFDQKITGKQMEWLKRGGRKLLYDLINEAERRLQDASLLGDFSMTIWLPSDIIVDLHEENGMGVFWTFGSGEEEEARRFADALKRNNPAAKVSVYTAKEYMGISGNTILVDMTWHGHDGADIICDLINQAFTAARMGPVTMAKLMRKIGEVRVKLPFPIPAVGVEEALEFSSKWCSEGDIIIMPNNKIYKHSNGRLREAGADEIIELTIISGNLL